MNLLSAVCRATGHKKFIWAPCAQLYSLADTSTTNPPTSPRIWAHIRGRHWSVSQDRRRLFVSPLLTVKDNVAASRDPSDYAVLPSLFLRVNKKEIVIQYAKC
jgi:hypothetical protein